MGQVFISYSHKDIKWKNRLITHLKAVERQGLVGVWHDRHIGIGEDWHPEIENAIKTAEVAILMITSHFLTSDFIMDLEVPHLLKRRKDEGLHIIPLIAEPCAWKEIDWFEQIQVFPEDDNPLSGGTKHQVNMNFVKLVEMILAFFKTSGKDNCKRVLINTGLWESRVKTSAQPEKTTTLTMPTVAEGVPEIPDSYRGWLSEQCTYMNIEKLQGKGRGIRLSLPEVFTPLFGYDPDAGASKIEGPGDSRKAVDIESLIAKQ